MRVCIGVVLTCLGVYSAFAADPKVESALKTFKAVAADAAKLKTFCEMTKAMDAAGEKPSAEDNARIESLMKALGPDFEAAWAR